MSFILDALKKAEAERQRQRGPTLLELRVAAPRRRWPVWSLLIGILLVANIIVVLSTALRPRQSPEPLPAPSAPAPAAAAAPASAAVVVVPTVLTTVPAVTAAPAPSGLASPPGGAAHPSSVSTTTGAGQATDEAELPVARTQGSNPADEEPAVPPARAQRAPPAAEATRSELELPSLSELGGTVPALRLDLHVYAERPADRYALINMHKAREGDMLPEGARVVAIDRDGVELSYQGTEFMLRPQ